MAKVDSKGVKERLEELEKVHSVVKGLGEVTENVRDEMLSHIRSFKEYFQPLLSEVEELRSFKEQTVGHQVKMIKQIKELQKEVDSIKEREGGKDNSSHSNKSSSNNSISSSNNNIHISKNSDNSNDCSNNSSSFKKEVDQVKNQLVELNAIVSSEKQEVSKLRQQFDSLNVKFELEHQATEKLTKQMSEISNNLATLGENITKSDAAIKENHDTKSQKPSWNILPSHHLPEWVLRERKRKNIIIFGLSESDNDGALVDSLCSDIGVQFATENDAHAIFRVGKEASGGKRPIVIKLKDDNKKYQILSNAKKLKGSIKWQKVVITHDLTKMECQEERQWEIELQHQAIEKNKGLSSHEKKSKSWKVIGGRGGRRIALISCNSNENSSNGGNISNNSNINNSNNQQQQQQQQQR